MSSSQPRSIKSEASVSHLIIFNPDLKPPPHPAEDDSENRDKDHEDDIKEASQILFYTSREGGKVSRDTMLRQFGLAKGLMGFTDMVLGSEAGKEGWWGVHSHKSRMIIWSPAQGFYIYLNVTLATEKNGETVHTSQGLLDEMIVDGLKRGYEDFRLLHGPLPALMPPSSNTSTILERFWTKFAFQSESIYLSPSNPGDILQTWLGGHPPPPSSRPHAPLDLGLDVKSGLISRRGPLRDPSLCDGALLRFLIHQLHLALPPPPPPPAPAAITVHNDRSTLGLGFGLGGRKKKPSTSTLPDESRSTSWTAWVPGMSGNGSWTGRDAPTSTATPSESASNRWPALGFGGMSTMFGLGKSSTDQISTDKEEPASASVHDETAAGAAEPQVISEVQEVQQTEVDLPDLEAAVQPEDEIELSWERKDVWLSNEDEAYEKRRVVWIIRDETLLYLIYPRTSKPPYPLPTTKDTLAVFASLNPSQPRASSESARTSQAGDGWLYHTNHNIESNSTIDPESLQTLAEMKSTLTIDTTLHEMYAKTSFGKFVIAKHTREGELYLQVNRKDASLTDAEQAVRSFARSHPAMPV